MNIDNYVKGWLVGDFEPALFNSKDIEVSIKYYKAGDKESSHVHKIATEYTVVVSGKVAMNDKVYNTKDIIKVKPGEYTDFESLENSITLVIKTPSVLGDKYLCQK